jgi:hypothetical protein
MTIERNINGVKFSVELTDDELVELITDKPIDERVVLFRKLAKVDFKSFLEIIQQLDIFTHFLKLKK